MISRRQRWFSGASEWLLLLSAAAFLLLVVWLGARQFGFAASEKSASVPPDRVDLPSASVEVDVESSTSSAVAAAPDAPSEAMDVGTGDEGGLEASVRSTSADHRQPVDQLGTSPRVAIVIDDLGRRVQMVVDLVEVGVPITFAVLPFETRTMEVVRALRERGQEFLCHLPMEPLGRANPGEGALLRSMTNRELVVATKRALAAVPGAVGVNNHMGSALSADGRSMSSVLDVVRREGLFFLDSRTTAESIAFDAAQELGVAAGRRDVFLDRERQLEAIREQFRHLLAIASEKGVAIGIGHPYSETLQVLREEVPRAQSSGVEFVRLSEVVE